MFSVPLRWQRAAVHASDRGASRGNVLQWGKLEAKKREPLRCLKHREALAQSRPHQGFQHPYWQENTSHLNSPFPLRTLAQVNWKAKQFCCHLYWALQQFSWRYNVTEQWKQSFLHPPERAGRISICRVRLPWDGIWLGLGGNSRSPVMLNLKRWGCWFYISSKRLGVVVSLIIPACQPMPSRGKSTTFWITKSNWL